MYNERILLFAVLVHVGHIERVRRRKIQLYGDKGVFLAVNVLYLNVEFRSVKRRFVVGFDVVYADIVQNFLHKRFGLVPRLVVVDIFCLVALSPFTETESNVVLHAETFEEIVGKIQTAFEFFFHLLRRADYMSVGKGELTYPYKPVHFPARFVAEFRRRFAVTAGKIPVTFKPVLIYLILERTGHRAKRYRFRRIFVADYKHLVAVVIPVPRNTVKIVFRHIRRFGYHKPALFFFVFHETRKYLQYLRAFRHKKRKSLTDNFFGHEYSQISSEFVVIALFGFF